MNDYAKAAAAVIAVIVVVSTIAYVGMGLGERRGQSEYTGHVVDVVEDKGVIFTPTWTNMKTDPRSSDIQSYCILPEYKGELLPAFYDAMENGGRYTVTYERPLFVNPEHCRGSDAIVTNIRTVNNSSQ